MLHRVRRSSVFVALIMVITLITGALPMATSASTPNSVTSASPEDAFRFQEDDAPEYDGRTGSVQPTSAQLTAVNALGATASWNAFGSPSSLIKYGDYLATGLSGDPATAVREWIRANRSLFRLSDADVTNLELVHNVQLVNSEARALLFRQHFGDLEAARDGLIAVGFVNGKITYVTASTAEWDGVALGSPTLSAAEAWQKAAADVGRNVALADITTVGLDQDGDWTLLSVAGFAQSQRVRLRALPTPTNGIQLVYDTVVLNVIGGEATAFSHLIDANTGDVWVRHNRKQHLAEQAAAETTAFSGTYQDAPAQRACGTDHNFTVGLGKTSITVVATAAVPSNDIMLDLFYNGVQVGHSDTATSPEGIVYAPAGGVLPGTYTVKVCPYSTPTVQPVPPYDYVGNFTTDDTPLLNTNPYPPKWNYFRANPPLDLSTTDTRTLGCWESTVEGVSVPGCELELKTPGGVSVWDVNARTGTTTYTTVGNNAQSAQSWYSALTPSVPVRPTSINREYNYAWTNQWQTSKCSPEVFASPQQNDTDAATANLFVLHNLMHDWSYNLGFREETYNLQESNRGNVSHNNKENDPEIGNVQAGAVNGGSPSYLGRDNANQITLQDGIAPITNMYLWQPIAAAFYSPCVDGDYDMSVVAHEYGHAIQNRMVAGPDEGLGTPLGRSMGESWSDLTAIEFLNGYGLVPTADENPFAVGPYVTGSKERGIRNYAMNRSSLNYSNVEYDGNGTTSPHADGEIWSATNYDIRQALIEKYNGSYPASDKALQKDCADGKKSADLCPGNRRWAQIFHDAFLLMLTGVTMDDARDAYLAADMMRFGGANQTELWRAFSRRGFGKDAASTNGSDVNPLPSFESPLESPATVTFKAVDEAGKSVDAKIYVGHYEARVVPVADTDPATPLTVSSSNVTLSNAAKFVPGSYDFLAQAPGYGFLRFSRSLAAGSSEVVLQMPTNLASSAKGAAISGNGGTQDKNLSKLIDDTETTNWARLNASTVAGASVTVDLAGDAHTIDRVQVSAANRPTIGNDPGGDTGGQSRFAALRQFEIYTCNATTADCTSDSNFTKVYTSPANAFPGGVPRPTAPDLSLRSFDIPDTTATHVQLRVLTNQCTGGPAYQGDQDTDPNNNSDCVTGSVQDGNVRAAELQVFAVNTPAPAPTAPAAPSNLTATAVSTSQINLAWTDNADNEQEFKIERSTSATTGFTQIATVGANTTTYLSSGLSGGKTYYYRVRASNSAGNSAYSNTTSAKTPRK